MSKVFAILTAPEGLYMGNATLMEDSLNVYVFIDIYAMDDYVVPETLRAIKFFGKISHYETKFQKPVGEETVLNAAIGQILKVPFTFRNIGNFN